MSITLALGVDAHLGQAAQLDQADASVDVVLLMGPLYHLVDESDRLQALREARRVLRPGGVVIATAISRFAALLDQLVRLDRFHDPSEMERVETITRTGVLPARDGGVFTTAFMHLPRQLRHEVRAAGFEKVAVVCVEGLAISSATSMSGGRMASGGQRWSQQRGWWRATPRSSGSEAISWPSAIGHGRDDDPQPEMRRACTIS